MRFLTLIYVLMCLKCTIISCHTTDAELICINEISLNVEYLIWHYLHCVQDYYSLFICVKASSCVVK